MDNSYRKRRINSVISSWMSFFFVLFFFYVLGYLIMKWWFIDWWVWLILGVFFFGAISTTLKFIAYRSTNVPSEPVVRHYTPQNVNTYSTESYQEYNQPISANNTRVQIRSKFCAYCGMSLDSESQYCSNCGAPVQ